MSKVEGVVISKEGAKGGGDKRSFLRGAGAARAPETGGRAGATLGKTALAA